MSKRESLIDIRSRQAKAVVQVLKRELVDPEEVVNVLFLARDDYEDFVKAAQAAGTADLSNEIQPSEIDR